MEIFSTFALRFGGRGFRFEGRGKERDVDGEMANKKYFIFYLRKRKSFLPLQSKTKRELSSGV